MFWKRPKPSWLIDPSGVALGSVTEYDGRNLSRTHVRVKYHREQGTRFVPLVTFFRDCNVVIRDGGSLGIDQLLVAPIVKRRYSVFFDRLTDWDPAMRRAYRPRSERERPPERELWRL